VAAKIKAKHSAERELSHTSVMGMCHAEGRPTHNQELKVAIWGPKVRLAAAKIGKIANAEKMQFKDLITRSE
jgi:hypothetical protein